MGYGNTARKQVQTYSTTHSGENKSIYKHTKESFSIFATSPIGNKPLKTHAYGTTNNDRFGALYPYSCPAAVLHADTVADTSVPQKADRLLPSVLVILSTAGFISVLYYLWQIVCDENNRWTDLGGMLAAGSWQEWVAWAFFGLFVVLFTAAGFSLFGFALTGHHPKFCKEMWRSLIGMILIPFLTLALLAASTLCISLSGMTLFTWLFSEAAFSDVTMLVLVLPCSPSDIWDFWPSCSSSTAVSWTHTF